MHWRDVHLVAYRFAPQDFSVQDPEACNITMPPTLQSAARKRQAEFLAGRLCARGALHKFDPSLAAPGIDIDGAPFWPDSYVGSISHSNGYAAAITAPRQRYMGIGIDIERKLTLLEASEISYEILTTSERRHLGKSKTDSSEAFIASAFSLKESLFKALYPSIKQRLDFKEMEITHWDRSGQASLRVNPGQGLQWLSPYRFDAYFNWVNDLIFSVVAIEKIPSAPS